MICVKRDGVLLTVGISALVQPSAAEQSLAWEQAGEGAVPMAESGPWGHGDLSVTPACVQQESPAEAAACDSLVPHREWAL